MKYLYAIIIHVYGWLIYLSSFFSEKSKLLSAGQKNTLWLMENSIEKGQPYIWVHAASLGEFEQGRPLIESIKQQYPNYKIVLTFFSPSGYEIRKNYPFADYVCYLPLDTPRNAKKFISLVQPQKAIFIKYEFWPNFLLELYKQKAEIYLVSAIFRPKQLFFKWYGQWYKQLLHLFTHIFVQDSCSAQILNQEGICQVSIAGDTRFDRVVKIASSPNELPIIEAFKQNEPLIVVGSSWQPEEEMMIRFALEYPCKIVFAPHDVSDEHIQSLQQKIGKNCALYGNTNSNDVKNERFLIINTIGILSSVYRYADVCVIGGGFGAGIHNVIEAAVYGKPVIFGPKYKKFKEARELIEQEAAFKIDDYNQLNTVLTQLLSNHNYLTSVGDKADNYVKSGTGATNTIIQQLFSTS